MLPTCKSPRPWSGGVPFLNVLETPVERMTISPGAIATRGTTLEDASHSEEELVMAGRAIRTPGQDRTENGIHDETAKSVCRQR